MGPVTVIISRASPHWAIDSSSRSPLCCPALTFMTPQNQPEWLVENLSLSLRRWQLARSQKGLHPILKPNLSHSLHLRLVLLLVQAHPPMDVPGCRESDPARQSPRSGSLLWQVEGCRPIDSWMESARNLRLYSGTLLLHRLSWTSTSRRAHRYRHHQQRTNGLRTVMGCEQYIPLQVRLVAARENSVHGGIAEVAKEQRPTGGICGLQGDL